MDLTEQEIAQILREHGVQAGRELCQAVGEYVSLLIKWNERVSLTSVGDPAAIVARHFAESLFAIEAVPIRSRRLVDVGSGAGFPGLALKLALPEAAVTLVEANAKKAAFLAEVVRALGLEGVRVFRGRTEQMELDNPIAEAMTSRATGHFGALLRWAEMALEPGGVVILWIGERDVAGIQRMGGWSWRFPIPLPKSERRVLLVGQRS